MGNHGKKGIKLRLAEIDELIAPERPWKYDPLSHSLTGSSIIESPGWFNVSAFKKWYIDIEEKPIPGVRLVYTRQWYEEY
jgi:hypothetical protein